MGSEQLDYVRNQRAQIRDECVNPRSEWHRLEEQASLPTRNLAGNSTVGIATLLIMGSLGAKIIQQVDKGTL